MIRLLRVLLLIPAVALGGFLAILATAIWNLPLTLLEWFLNLFGDWSLWGFIFGKEVSTYEILYVLSSGVFMSLISLYLAISVFPYQKHRKKIAYLLSIYLLVSFSTASQLKIYEGEVYLFVIKIIGVFLGALYIFLIGRESRWSFDFIDKLFNKEELKKPQVTTNATQESRVTSLIESVKYPDSFEEVPSSELISIAEKIFKIGQANSFGKEGLNKLNAIRAELATRKERREKYFLQHKVETTRTEIAELEDELKEITAMRIELEKSKNKI